MNKIIRVNTNNIKNNILKQEKFNLEYDNKLNQKIENKKNNTNIETINLSYQDLNNNNISFIKYSDINNDDKEIIVDFFENNGIKDIKSSDIKKIESNGENGYIVELKSGDIVYFSPNSSNEQKIVGIKLANGEYLAFYSGESINQETIHSRADIKENISIKGLLSIDEDTSIYWLENTSFKRFLAVSNNIIESLNNYPSNVKDYILNSKSFEGFYIGDFTALSDQNAIDIITLEGLAYSGKRIMINTIFPITSKWVVTHELAHILDYLLGENHYLSNTYTIYELYKEYDKPLRKLLDLSDGYKITGHPNSLEFFADLVTIYLTKPEKLKRSIPELYEYIDNLINNI